ncbi:hypothetical protein [Pandoraea sputorum]|uniref:hypothetical protein n=1 Tax=Pandoraea sputorum TaxID=93222 RepID=UPI001240A8B0|nr:hypothetical protein [Pandoraea sputorum]VVE78131.1 hypothetical protein PSP31120_01511 [Pandoraea sputorum]
MTTHTMHQENGYFFWVTGVQLKTGKWDAYVYFERVADHDGQKEFVPCMRTTLKGGWASRQEAETVAKVEAFKMAADGNTGL